MDKIIINSKLFKGLLSKVITKYLRTQIESDDGYLKINSFMLDHKGDKTRIDVAVTLELSDEDIKTLFKRTEE